jgi:uncharacterized protein (DUF1499 family)
MQLFQWNLYAKISMVGALIIVLTGCKTMQPIDFHQLSLPKTPNFYLICPPNFCNAHANQYSPEFNVNVKELESRSLSLIAQQPRVNLISSQAAKHQYQFVQRSLIFRFPDYIDVQFIPVSQDKSTLAMFSRSKYGHSDLGVNKKRLQKWLELLTNAMN